MLDPLEHLQMLKDRAAGIASRQDALNRVRALRFTEPGFDRDVWRDMCRQGWLSRRGRELCAVAEELGANLAPEPLVAAAMVAQLLPPAGDRVVMPAWQETPGSIGLSGETALHNGKLNGRKSFIPMAAGADAFLVTVPGGFAVVERGAPGALLRVETTEDGGNLATLELANAPAQWIEGDAAEALEHAIMGHCAYLLGVVERAFTITLADIERRERSGYRIASLEAMRHRVDDMRVQLSLTRATIENGAQVLDTAAPLNQKQAAVSRAKLRASDAAMVIPRTCLHLHGGIGLTDAYDITLYVRKATVMAPLYGSAAAHRRRLQAIAEATDE